MNPLSVILVIMFVIFGLPILGFIFIIFKIAVKTKQSSWTGEVVDKLSGSTKDDDDRESSLYTLVVKSDDNLTRKIAVTKSVYDSIKVGDKMEKPLGALNPTKI